MGVVCILFTNARHRESISNTYFDLTLMFTSRFFIKLSIFAEMHIFI